MENAEVPEGGFGVVVADPNWEYRNFSKKKHGAAVSHYRLSPSEEIKKVPVLSWMKEDAVLLLWNTWPKLDDGISVLKHWGFRYVSAFPWVKVVPKEIDIDIDDVVKAYIEEVQGKPKRILSSLKARVHEKVRRGIGFWTQSASEVILIGVRGDPRRRTKRTETPIGLLTGEPRQFWHAIGKHSQKPEGIQDWVEMNFDGPYLELYGRRERPGWTVWGDEVGFLLSERGVERIEEPTEATCSTTSMQNSPPSDDVSKSSKAESSCEEIVL